MPLVGNRNSKFAVYKALLTKSCNPILRTQKYKHNELIFIQVGLNAVTVKSFESVSIQVLS